MITRPRKTKKLPATRGSLEPIDRFILILLAVSFTALPAYLKMQSGDDGQNNSLKQILWSLVYVACGIRLFQIGKIKEALARLSLFWIFCAYMFLTAIWSVDQQVTMVNAIELTGSTVVACYLAMRFTIDELIRFLGTIFGLTIFLSFIFLTIFRNHGYQFYGSGEWTGFFPEKNALGASMSLGLITFSGLISESRGRRRAIYALAFICCAILLFGSNSMTSTIDVILVSYAVGCTIFSRSSTFARVIVAASLIIIVIAYAAGISPNTLIVAVGRTPNLSGRDEMWPFVKLAIADRPIFGYGYNAFFQSDIAKPFFTTVASFGFRPPYHAHNSFLQILIAGGYVGLIIFCLALGKALLDSFRYILKSSDRLAFWPLAILLFLTIGSSDETYFPVINSFEWLVLIAAALLTRRETVPQKEDRLTPLLGKASKFRPTRNQTPTPLLRGSKNTAIRRKRPHEQL